MEEIKDEAMDLEVGDVVWVKEFKEWLGVDAVYVTMGDTAITFDNGETLFFDRRRRFKHF